MFVRKEMLDSRIEIATSLSVDPMLRRLDAPLKNLVQELKEFSSVLECLILHKAMSAEEQDTLSLSQRRVMAEILKVDKFLGALLPRTAQLHSCNH